MPTEYQQSVGAQRLRDSVRTTLEAALRTIDADGISANFLVRGETLFEGQPTRIDFEKGVAASVVTDVVVHASRLAGLELIEYDPSFQPSRGQALVDRLERVPELARIHDQIIRNTPLLDTGGTAFPGHRGDSTHRIAGMVHRIDGTRDDRRSPITAYRLKGPGIATQRPSGVRLLLPRGGIYERVDSEIVFYEPRFDAIVVGDVVIVTAPMTLQRKLGSDARARRAACETFSTATARIRISGLNDLTEAVSHDPAMIAKMMQLRRTLADDPDYAAALTTDRLLEFLGSNPHIAIAVEGVGSERSLIFDPSPQRRYLIPKVLADDFLRSDLTSRAYEVGSKLRLDNS